MTPDRPTNPPETYRTVAEDARLEHRARGRLEDRFYDRVMNGESLDDMGFADFSEIAELASGRLTTKEEAELLAEMRTRYYKAQTAYIDKHLESEIARVAKEEE